MTSRLSLAFVIILFPGIFFYSSAVGAQLIPAFIGGGVGFFSALALGTLMPSLILSVVGRKGAVGFLTALFFVLMFYTMVWFVAHYFLGGSFQGSFEVLRQWATLVATWLALFSIGYFFPAKLNKAYFKMLFACMAGIAVTVLLNIDFRRLIFIFGVNDIEGSLSYQGLARSAAVSGLILLSVIRSLKVAVVVVLFLLTTLFFIGARSELFGVVAVLPFVAYLHFLKRPLSTVTAVLVVGLLALGLLVNAYDQLSGSRQFQILNIAASTSGMARADFGTQAIEAIRRSPVFGDFAGDVKNHGPVGAYAHNVLSAWRQLGLVGFILYFTLMLGSLIFSLRELRKSHHQDTDLPRIAAVLSLFCLILVLVAKPIFWSLPALAWGLTGACYRYKPIANIIPKPSNWHGRAS